MQRRDFLKIVFGGVLAVGPLVVAGGCIAPRISSTAYDTANGQPWRCEVCGHLTRSNDDLTETRCPRCRKRRLRRISEEELKKALQG